MFKTINPYSLEIIEQYRYMEFSGIDNIINNSHYSFLSWKIVPISQRCRVFETLAKILKDNIDNYARLISNQMGKPLSQAKGEINKAILGCDYYIQNSEEFLKDSEIKSDNNSAIITKKPIGVIFGIMPWNFPFWQVLRIAIPTIMAGNSFILKHAENVTGCALALKSLFDEAGFGDLFDVILCDHDTAAKVISHKLIAGVAFTGSIDGGKTIASIAGTNIKKSLLELGGSDPYIVLEDADIELAAQICVQSRMGNAGQTCVAAKRFIIHDNIYDDFVSLLIDNISNFKMGNPLDDDVNLGPLAREDLRDKLHNQVIQTVGQGGKCLIGGDIPDKQGLFYNPTILSDVTSEMIAYHQELFGPVFTLIRAKNETEAIHIANDTIFGLGSAVFTKDIEKGMHIISDHLEVGMGAVNKMVASEPSFPFGGVKQSGYGRELSHYGINEFVNIKTVIL